MGVIMILAKVFLTTTLWILALVAGLTFGSYAWVPLVLAGLIIMVLPDPSYREEYHD
jgi:hypothetical protein